MSSTDREIRNAKQRAEFAGVFVAWMRRAGVPNPSHAAPILGVGTAAAYGYANGTSTPPATRIPHLARIMGVRERVLRRAVLRDRAARLHSGDHTPGGAA